DPERESVIARTWEQHQRLLEEIRLGVDDLDGARKAAHYLASAAAGIHALSTDGASEQTIARLTRELNQNYPDARKAIGSVAMELKLIRNCPVKLGDVVAPTAHEAAVELVFALNRSRCGFEIFGLKPVHEWHVS